MVRLVLAAAVSLALLAAPAARARTIVWSGQSWDVRPVGTGEPGPNAWSDSEANVHVDGADLVLSVAQGAGGAWTSAEVDGRRSLGYGTYRWVVASDLSGLDANEVLGMFTYGGDDPSNNELDLEASHWGNLAWASGSGTVWQDASAGLRRSRTFAYTARPPYVHQFTWEPGRVRYLVSDGAGATLLDWTLTEGIPRPSTEVPMINYWRFRNVPPAGPRSIRISSFGWTPPGPDQTPLPPPAGSPVTARPPGGATGCAVTARRTLRWRATARARLRLTVRRAAGRGRFVTVAARERALHPGSGRIGLARLIGRRRLRRAVYRVVATPVTRSTVIRCGRAGLRISAGAG